MPTTNHTTNYSLSQYVAGDVTSYMDNYNSDMLKIDAAIHGVSVTATTAGSDATAAVTTANAAKIAADKASSDIGAVKSTADTAMTTSENAQTTANSALTASGSNGSAISTINTKLGKFGWTAPTAVTNIHAGFSPGSETPKCSYNEGCQLMTIFGKLSFATGANIASGSTLFRLPSNVKLPSSTRTITSFCPMVGKAKTLAVFSYLQYVMSVEIDSSGNIICLNDITNITGSDYQAIEIDIQLTLVVNAW